MSFTSRHLEPFGSYLRFSNSRRTFAASDLNFAGPSFYGETKLLETAIRTEDARTSGEIPRSTIQGQGRCLTQQEADHMEIFSPVYWAEISACLFDKILEKWRSRLHEESLGLGSSSRAETSARVKMSHVIARKIFNPG